MGAALIHVINCGLSRTTQKALSKVVGATTGIPNGRAAGTPPAFLPVSVLAVDKHDGFACIAVKEQGC